MATQPRPTLSECLEGRGNNLDVLRFAAAAGVIVSHSFPLGEGPKAGPEPLTVFTRGQVSLGLVCVAVFLVISGLLISRSWERSRDVRSFLLARTLRIFPGLAVSLLLTTFVLGAAFTTHSLRDYFSAPDTYTFLLRNFTLVNPQWNLPGVFEGNVYPSAVNGSLWTLKYEVGFYLLVLGLGVTGLLRKELALAGWCVTAVLSFLHIGRLGFWPVLGLYFGGGLVLYLWRERVRMSPWLAAACVLVLIAASLAGKGLPVAIGSCGAYLVLYLAFLPSRLAGFGRHGDFSYGLYIYAFPVQQAVTAMLGGPMPWWWNATLSLAATLLLGMMSWRYIEEPAISRRHRERSSPPPSPTLMASHTSSDHKASPRQ